MDPNEEEKPGVPLDELLRRYYGDELVKAINHSSLHLRKVLIETYAGDVVTVSLSPATSRQLKRVIITVLTAALVALGWGLVPEEMVKPRVTGQPVAEFADHSEGKT